MLFKSLGSSFRSLNATAKMSEKTSKSIFKVPCSFQAAAEGLALLYQHYLSPKRINTPLELQTNILEANFCEPEFMMVK